MQPIVYIDESRIRPGRLEAVRKRIPALSDFIERNNRFLVFYGFYLDEDAGRMTVISVHPDSAGLAHHMDVGREEFRKFADLLEITSMSVYGPVDRTVVERLRSKAAMLGGCELEVHRQTAGFARFVGELPSARS